VHLGFTAETCGVRGVPHPLDRMPIDNRRSAILQVSTVVVDCGGDISKRFLNALRQVIGENNCIDTRHILVR
jgi:hypothetical protein